MQYVTGIERRALNKGFRKGLLSSISLGLELKFDSEGLRLLTEISEIEDIETLQRIEDILRTCNSIDEIKAVYQT